MSGTQGWGGTPWAKTGEQSFRKPLQASSRWCWWLDELEPARLIHSKNHNIAPKTQPSATTAAGVVTALGFEPKGEIQTAHG